MSFTVPLYGFGGGGGAALDLKIIPGLARPANPTPNMIWAKTDKDITGYALSAEKPENPTEGLLWLGISDSSEIKATVPVGKEYITLYFLTGAIYTSRAWTDVPVMSYQNWGWAEWFQGVYLFNKGDECKGITGGWTVGNSSNGRWKKDTGSIVADYVNDESVHGWSISNDPLNAKEYSKICVEVTVNSVYSDDTPILLGLHTGEDMENSSYMQSSYKACISFTESGVHCCDISGVNVNTLHVVVGSAWKGKIHRIWAEK